jgi:hypothetical protein
MECIPFCGADRGERACCQVLLDLLGHVVSVVVSPQPGLAHQARGQARVRYDSETLLTPDGVVADLGLATSAESPEHRISGESSPAGRDVFR